MAGQLLQSLKLEFQSWFAKAPTIDSSDVLDEPPPGFITQLTHEIQSLSAPLPYQKAIHKALGEAFNQWQEQPETNNSLVILGSPVDAIAPLLETTLRTRTHFSKNAEPWQRARIRFPLESKRSSDPLAILTELRKALDRENLEDLETLEQEDSEADPESLSSSATDQEPTKMPTIVVIPNLERCFLRCIQGWEGVEYLQNLVAYDPSYFWVLGCSHWTWAFLDRVCHIRAYLEEVVHLPKLDGDELKEWLQPLMATVAASTHPEDPEAELDLGSDAYWNALASTSAGISTTAAHLWLQSLRIRAEDLDEGSEEQHKAQGRTSQAPPTSGSTDEAPHSLRPIKPSLPSLIDLDSMDRYLLHALLIHGKMTRSHLALSLGEAEQTIRSRVQVLRREGVIIQQGTWLWVHPAHYPKLRSELGNNNFLTGSNSTDISASKKTKSR